MDMDFDARCDDGYVTCLAAMPLVMLDFCSCHVSCACSCSCSAPKDCHLRAAPFTARYRAHENRVAYIPSCRAPGVRAVGLDASVGVEDDAMGLGCLTDQYGSGYLEVQKALHQC